MATTRTLLHESSWHTTNILDPVTETINNRTEPMVHGGCNTSPSSLSSSCRYCTRCGDCFFTEFLPRPVPASTVLSFARTAEGNGKKSVDINRDLSPPPPPLPHRKLTEPIDTVMCPGGHAAHSMKHVRAGELTHFSRT